MQTFWIVLLELKNVIVAKMRFLDSANLCLNRRIWQFLSFIYIKSANFLKKGIYA
ncbi:hypothetical protein [Helicobacter sp. 23-1045]